MTDSRRQFPLGAGGPAWGQSHLSLDAVVAFADDELSPGARRRAMNHLAGCIDCAAEVVAQTQARLALRAGSAPPPTSSLLSRLAAIPEVAELPAAPAGLAVGPNGQLMAPTPRAVKSGGPRLDRRIRLGGAAVVSGLALGALMFTGTGGAPSAPGPVQLRPGSAVDANLRLGAGSVRDAVDRTAGGPAHRPFTRKLAHQRWAR